MTPLKYKYDSFTVRAISSGELGEENIRQWAELEQRAAEGNAYLSPHFILPALRHVTPKQKPVFIFVEGDSGNSRGLLGVGVFTLSTPTRTLPFPHLKAYRCTHSYLTGLLVDRDSPQAVVRAFLSFFSSGRHGWHGVEFEDLCQDSELARQLDRAVFPFNTPWFEYRKKSRAILKLENIEKRGVEPSLSPKKRKNLRKCQRDLEKSGAIGWRAVTGPEIDQKCIDTFLRLENMGWKRERSTSLESIPAHRDFFIDMVKRFAQHGGAFFTELSVGGRVVASTSNLISGKAGFAFKVGWDTEFAKASPGILNEIEFLRNANGLLPGVEYIDSGAEEGSFIETLWPERRVLISGFYATSALAATVLYGLNGMRVIKRGIEYIRGRLHGPLPVHNVSQQPNGAKIRPEG